ncbi:licC protein [Streptococcus pneumoniae 2081074]|nr:licC protein [Streptococcus pneumoniae GA54644]EHE76825.1 licC protein [Streptococcus pneumoniae GA11663]EJG55408.1 licC protein [Streptococcus pneumoniae 2072047]EJG68875.1 licC protein [Streptococcus pneumoniae 2081074]
MKAIILAAGLGTRLRPMTENTPKALVQVNQKPLIEYQIEFLKEKGINDIIIIVGYLKEQFDYLKENTVFASFSMINTLTTITFTLSIL